MPCTESEEEFNAPRSPTMLTPTNTSRNSGAGHGEPDAETESENDESEQDECDKSDGKPRRKAGWLEYVQQATWDIGPESTLERADIDNEIKQLMTKFMQDARLFKTPGHQSKSTDIYLWKRTVGNITTRNRKKPFEFTSVQWRIAANAMRVVE